MQSRTAIIIGGGVIGLSAAYYLARKRFGKIILLEKGRLGDGSSSRAGGIITGLLWSKTGVEARKISLALYRELSDDLAAYGYRFQDVGCLNLFDPPSWPEREQLLPLYAELEAPYEIIDATEIRYRWPDLTPTEEIIGLHDPLGGYSEPHRYIPALAQRLRDLGVELREGQQVTDFVMRNGCVVGVTTREGTLEADVVICTVHTWTLKVIERLGWQLPIKAFVHQRYVSAVLPKPINIPAVNANLYQGYIRPADGGNADIARILAGGETAERMEYQVPSLDFQMSVLSAPPEVKDRLKTSLAPLLPRLRETTWEHEAVGLISFSMDGEPILGPVRQFPGLYLGSSFHSGGFAYSPVAGLMLAEFVADGQTRINLAAFSPERFDPEATAAYLARPLAQKDAVQRRH
jgi:glycine/D-amino acid oxidase-like deaminating enzyme